MNRFNFFAKRNNYDFKFQDYDSDTDSTSGSMNSLDRIIATPDSGYDDVEDYQLNSTWNIYYLRPNSADLEWDDRLVFVTSFSTVREFWSVYNHLKLPSRLTMGCDYMIFRDGIKPEWTDNKNQDGGRWILEIDRIYRNEQLDQQWLETLLALIGETLYPNDDNSNPQICGAIVQSRKKMDRVGLWTRDAENEQAVLDIGTNYRNFLRPQNYQKLKYQSHKANQNRQNSFQNYLHQI
jgi:translation initiation factor 4E